MDVLELTGKIVKICQSSITAKDECGKTCGIVKNIISYGKSTQPRIKFDYKQKARTAWKNGQAEKIIIDGANVYFLYDTSADDLYKEYFEGKDICGAKDERARMEKRAEMLEAIKADGATVIYCKKVIA